MGVTRYDIRYTRYEVRGTKWEDGRWKSKVEQNELFNFIKSKLKQ